MRETLETPACWCIQPGKCYCLVSFLWR